MNSQTAWQAAVGQLQMEMSKASFETWVRSTEVLKYEDGTFTIGVQNAYARDWLEKRLTVLKPINFSSQPKVEVG